MTGFLIASGVWWGAWIAVAVYLRRHRWEIWARREEDADLFVIDADEQPAHRPGPIEWSEDIYGAKTWKGLQPGDCVYVGDHLVFLADAPLARMTAA